MPRIRKSFSEKVPYRKSSISARKAWIHGTNGCKRTFAVHNANGHAAVDLKFRVLSCALFTFDGKIMTNLFTYGSLMSEDIMGRVSGSRNASQSAILRNFRRVAVQKEDYPAVFPSRGGEVNGRVYFDLSSSALLRLDNFEGEYYSREEVTVITEDGVQTPAMVYIFRPQYYHLLTQEEWSYEDFLATGKDRFTREYCGFTKIE